MIKIAKFLKEVRKNKVRKVELVINFKDKLVKMRIKHPQLIKEFQLIILLTIKNNQFL